MKTNDLVRLNTHLSAQVRAHRARLKMTLREMDEVLAMPGGTTSRIERGDKRLDCVTMHRLAGFLKLSVDDFFVGAPEVDIATYFLPPNGVDVSDVEVLLEIYRTIKNPEIRREILSLVRSVAESSVYD